MIQLKNECEHDNYGDFMTLAEFRKCVESGGFIDYDGFGYPANEHVQWEGERIWPSGCSDDFYAELAEAGVTHIRWYNR